MSDRPAPGGPMRILVVDDNEDAATSSAMLLADMGNEVRTARDGEEAVRLAGDYRPHAVLMDIGLPLLNGYDACRRIREQPWGASMILVALTGWDEDDEKQKARDAGFDRHLVKPVEPERVMKVLRELEAARNR